MKYNHRFYMPCDNFAKEPLKSRNPNFMKLYAAENQSLPILRNKGKNSSLSTIETANNERSESVGIQKNQGLSSKHKSVQQINFNNKKSFSQFPMIR